MKYWICWLSLVAAAGACAAETNAVVPGSLEDLARFRKPPGDVRMVVDGFLWVEAEDFADYGEWRLDTQFVHKMGSAYLLAAGVGRPIRDAATEVMIPRAGRYHVWVRTKNWLKEFSPGTFTISVGGRKSGRTLGAASDDRWTWESAGEFELSKGSVKLALVDLSGAFARCDALILASDPAYRPSADLDACRKERARLTGAPSTIADGGAYDVVVAGAGTAGVGAAIAATRASNWACRPAGRACRTPTRGKAASSRKPT